MAHFLGANVIIFWDEATFITLTSLCFPHYFRRYGNKVSLDYFIRMLRYEKEIGYTLLNQDRNGVFHFMTNNIFIEFFSGS